MSKVYYTTYNHDTNQYTGNSMLMPGFDTLEQVVELMGDPIVQYKGFLKYPDGCYTYCICRIDPTVSSGVQ